MDRELERAQGGAWKNSYTCRLPSGRLAAALTPGKVTLALPSLSVGFPV